MTKVFHSKDVELAKAHSRDFLLDKLDEARRELDHLTARHADVEKIVVDNIMVSLGEHDARVLSIECGKDVMRVKLETVIVDEVATLCELNAEINRAKQSIASYTSAVDYQDTFV